MTEAWQWKEVDRYQKTVQSNTESFLDAYATNKKMLVESITETQEAILQLRPKHSLNSSDLHACEMSSLNICFGTTIFLEYSLNYRENWSMPTEEHPLLRKQT